MGNYTSGDNSCDVVFSQTHLLKNFNHVSFHFLHVTEFVPMNAGAMEVLLNCVSKHLGCQDTL